MLPNPEIFGIQFYGIPYGSGSPLSLPSHLPYGQIYC